MVMTRALVMIRSAFIGCPLSFRSSSLVIGQASSEATHSQKPSEIFADLFETV
jgi:hypothetical protein